MSTSDMSSPYRGLTPYTEADAPYFFGRAAEIATTAANLEVARLTIFYGPSGVGKSSVLRAGVFNHLLHQAQAAYAATGCAENIPVYFNRWQHDPLVSLTQSIAVAVQPFQVENQGIPDISQVLSVHVAEEKVAHTGFAAALWNWTVQTNSDLLLMLDQFEEYFLYHTGEAGPGTFAYELIRAVNSPLLRVNFLLSLREDTLARLDYFKGQIPFLFDNRLSITHLHRAAGREAVTRPLDQYNRAHGTTYTIEPALVEAVLDQVTRGKVALARQGAGLMAAEAGVEQIESPYLQLVLTRLWEQEQGQGSTTLRLATLDALGGAEKIVSNYLDDTMASLSAGHQAIAARFFDRLITIGGTKIALSLDELIRYAKADTTEVQQVLQQLQTKRLLRGVQSPTGTTQYEIFHDVLAQAILAWQSRVPWRTAEHYLDSGLFDWRESKRSKQTEILLDYERYQYIWSSKAAFDSIPAETSEFLTRTALSLGDISFSYWLKRLIGRDEERLGAIMADYVLHPSENKRKLAQNAIIQAKQHCLLDSVTLQKLAELFFQLFQFSANGVVASAKQNHVYRIVMPSAEVLAATTVDIRASTARLLWSMRKFLSTSHLVKVAPIAFSVWARDHRSSPMFISAVTSLLVTFVIWIAWLLNQNLRSTWTYPQSQLFAGTVSAFALVKSDPNLVYAVTQRGHERGTGATLLFYNREQETWHVLKSSFTSNPINTMLITESEGRKRVYISVWGKGIIRSDDNGQSWQSINLGLNSYNIVKLVEDEDNPGVLYAGSADSRGVFESQDGGDTWQDISSDELFGASVTVMSYTSYRGGILLVCTDDTRCLTYKKGEPAWQLVWSAPRTGPIVALSTEQTEKLIVYAGTKLGDIWVSTDGGGPDYWQKLGKVAGVFYINSIITVPGQPRKAFMSTYGIGGNLIWHTEDQGRQWLFVQDNQFTREPVGLYIHEQQPGNLFAVGAPGLFESHNDGSAWIYHALYSPIAAIHRMAISAVDSGPTYAAVGGAIFATREGADATWQRGYGVTAMPVRDIVTDPLDPNRAYASVYLPNRWSVLFTVDGGKTWQPTVPPSAIPQKLLNDTMALAIAKNGQQTILYAGTYGCGVIHSIDQGNTWETFGRQTCQQEVAAPQSIIDMAVSPQSSSTLYVAADNTRVYVSIDRGEHWQVSQIPLTDTITAIEVDPLVKGRVYLIAGAEGFWRSDDGAQSWQKHAMDLEEQSIDNLVVIPTSSETLYISASNGGIWKTTNGGKRWLSVKENLVTSGITELAYDQRTQELVLSSWQDGLYRFK